MLPRRRRRSRHRRGGRSPVRDRAAARGGRAPRAPDRPYDRDAHARRPCLRARPPRARAWYPDQHPPAAGVEYPNDPMVDGDAIEVGAVTLGVIHTPGHRPEHCCLTVIDTSRGDEPWLVLTGDSLFVGDTARPDLAVGAQRGRRGPLPLAAAPARARRRRRGVSRPRGRLALRQVDELEALDDDRLRAALQPVLADHRLGRVHRRSGRDRRAEAAEPRTHRRGEPRAVRRRYSPPRRSSPPRHRRPSCSTSARRPCISAGHRPGAINVPVSGTSFATKAGFVLDAARPVCVLAATADEAGDAIRGLAGGGVLRHRRVRPRRRRRANRRASRSTSSRARRRRASTVIDVREKDERETGYIPGSRNIPYRLMGALLPRSRRRPTRGHDLRERRPGRHRREHSSRPRLRRSPRHRRRPRGVAPAWRRDRNSGHAQLTAHAALSGACGR